MEHQIQSKFEEKNIRRNDIIVVSFIAVVFAYSFISEAIVERDLMMHQRMILGTVIKNSTSKGRVYFYYNFNFEGKEYNNSYNFYSNRFYIESMIGRKFPVIFSSVDANNNRMMIFPRDFERYGFRYPDSMRIYQKLLK